MQTRYHGSDTHTVRRTTEKHMRAKKWRRRSFLAPIAIALFVIGLAAAPTNATILSQVAKLLAVDDILVHTFGGSIAINRDTLVIGASLSNGSGLISSGTTYVFTRGPLGFWRQQAKLVAVDADVSDGFGASVAISGDIIVVGTPRDDDLGMDSGSVYIFTRDDAGVWEQQAKFLPTVGVHNGSFGWSVAVSEGTVVVGELGNSENGFFSGSVHIFTRGPLDHWRRQAILLASDGAERDLFGSSVSISKDTVIVGAERNDDACPDNINCSSGSAYIFTRDDKGEWEQQSKLLASDMAQSAHFGASVAIEDDIAIIGAFGDSNSVQLTGSAYIFKREESGSWKQEAKLLATDGTTGDYFGNSVAISAGTAIVGAHNDDDHGQSSGSAYVFTRGLHDIWKQQAKLLPTDGALGDFFGLAITVSHQTVMVGALSHDNNEINTGAVYVYDLAQLQPCLVQTDFNGDGVVNAADLATLLSQWGGPGAADITGDGVVDALDLSGLLAGWGPCP